MTNYAFVTEVTKNGDLDAKHYKANSQLQYFLAQDPLQAYSFTGHEFILDIGCGDGKITAQLADKAPNGLVIGIDKSPSMIDLAQALFPSEKHPNLKFEIQDATCLALSNSFDLITSFSCLHWVKNQKLAIENIYQFLKPSGKAMIITFPRCSTFWDPIEAVAHSEKWKAYFLNNPFPYHFLNEEEYKKILKEVGFKIINIETSSHIAKFNGKKGFEDYVRGWLPFLIDLPPSFHDQFLEEIGDKSLEFIPLSEDECVYHPYEKIFIIVEKSNEL